MLDEPGTAQVRWVVAINEGLQAMKMDGLVPILQTHQPRGLVTHVKWSGEKMP